MRKFIISAAIASLASPAFADLSALSASTTLSVSGPVLAPPRIPASPEKNLADKSPDTATTFTPYNVAAGPATEYSWTMILNKYVQTPDSIGLARFNYGALHASAADRRALKDYITSLEATDVSSLSTKAATAFWANLYNAVTIQVVVDNYPVTSIRDIKSGWRAGPWKRDLVTVAGRKLSLDDIEHKILREKYPSPLVHYMINCASIGCPNLSAKPWTAETLDADRDIAARAFINSPRGVRITQKGLKVSSIYKWFKEDFGGNEAGVLAHLRDYADDDLAQAIDSGAKIVDYGYSWSLNE